MGLYTQHWERYRKQTLRGALCALAIVGVGVPAIALAGFLLRPLNHLRTALLVSLAAVWLVLLVSIVVRSSRVVCPRCSTRYSRGRFLVTCPKCGLRMLQENP